MSVEYEDNSKFKALAAILEDYTEWFAQLALYIAYSDEERPFPEFNMPRSFTDWLEDTDSNAEISSAVIQPIVDMHSAMKDIVADLMDDLKAGHKPKHRNFVEFKNLYSSFLSSIRRLEKDSAIEGEGTDELTGLRPAAAVKKDMDREMQRLSRNGNPFSLMIVRFDQFVRCDNLQEALFVVADNIKKSMRPFDDAYYLGDGRFLISLKHADLVGAEAAMMRIQQSLNIDERNTDNLMTLSCCMAEPVGGDEISDLLENMQNDLSCHAEDRGAMLKFLDVSPLVRFVESRQ